MRIKYWTVRVVFDPLRIGEAGVGLIALDEDSGEVMMRRLRSDARVWNLVVYRDGVIAWLRNLENRLKTSNGASHLEVDPASFPNEYISRLQRQMHNTIRIDSPQYAAGESVAQVADLLFETFIAPEPATISSLDVRALRKTVIDEYTSRKILEESLVRSPKLTTRGRSTQLDIAIIGSNVLELNRAFSFAVNPTSQLEDRVVAWTYGVDELRRFGGILNEGTDAESTISRETPVVAVVEEPQTDHQNDLFREATRNWTRLGIIPIQRQALSEHADTLVKELSKTA